MAYDPTRMSLLGPTSAGMLWSYYSLDGKSTVQLVSYFLPIWQQLDPGDRIHCHCGGAIFDLAIVAVTANSISTVASLNYA